MSAELERLIHKFAIEMTFTIEKHLPAILEGIATDIRLNADKRYKKSLENN
jgi:hypothetical protein